ncbi:hypothetical protein [Streptomyces phaeofaciens]|nr:hypothetical protein [Streptomyces phaeofaciens]
MALVVGRHEAAALRGRDGEAVVYVADDEGNTRIGFEAAHSRALPKPRRARPPGAMAVVEVVAGTPLHAVVTVVRLG